MKVGHTTGVYVPYSFRTVVFVLFLRVDFQYRVVFTCVNFTFANKIEVMHERSLVSVKVEPRSTSRSSLALFILPLFYLRD